jgi:putative ABC transport system ATP-binding protein
MVLELDSVRKTYPGDPPVDAVKEITLGVARGELVGVVGASGSGKSTLLHLCGTLERPSSGTVRIAGTDIAACGDAAISALRAAEIGFVFQHFFLLDGLSARDNVATGLLYRGVAAAERRERAELALAQVELAHRSHHLPAQLSGGERQRVAIARALVGDPSIMLADEPTGNLDSTTGASILELMLQLHANGATIMVITHNPELAARLPRTVILRDGRILSDSGSAR